MKEYIHYDSNIDHFTLYFGKGKVHKTIEGEYILFYFNNQEELIGLEIMKASKVIGIKQLKKLNKNGNP